MEKSTINNYVIVSKIPAPVYRYKQSALLAVRYNKEGVPSHNTLFPSISEKEDFILKDSGKSNKQMRNLIRSGLKRSILKKKEDDLDSVESFSTNVSGTTNKSNCEHTNFAKNGTTYSGRLHKYIVHCQDFNDSAEYLTPTQRADRIIKRLKSLLQLAKEKLREKEEEIFKLTKEVAELKIFKASVNSRIFKKESSDLKEILSAKEENSIINGGANIQNFDPTEDLRKNKFHHDSFSNFSSIKNFLYFEQTKDDVLKLSSISPYQELDEKMSATPDFLLSLADSGNFDDLTSSVSLYSKDSVRFSPDLDLYSDEKSLDESVKESETYAMQTEDEHTLKILNAYESELQKKKLEYELELKRVVNEQNEKNVCMMRKFENRLNEEVKFEERWIKLVQATEEEKKGIVNRFERKLVEEKERYLKILLTAKSIDRRKSVNDISGKAYIRAVEEEKSIYESSLLRMKLKFENEKVLIEKTFVEAMLQEREKFEEKIINLKRKNDNQITELLSTITEYENRYKEVLPKYNEMINKNKELEAENSHLKKALIDQEEKHKNNYLKLYMKGQEDRFENESKMGIKIDQQKNKALVPELLLQLKVTQEELENLKDKEYRAVHTDEQGLCLLSSKEAISLWMLAARKAMYKRLAEKEAKSSFKDGKDENAEASLQFLKSAVFYFLIDRNNHLGHLKAIESILGFSAAEKSQIEKSYPW